MKPTLERWFLFGQNLKQACDILSKERDTAAPPKILCWLVEGDLDDDEYWRMSWALNSVGHSVVPVTTYDWIMGVKKARLAMYVPPPRPSFFLLHEM